MIAHLWQSTAFAGIAAFAAWALRHHRARVRYAVWLAASVKFLIPMAWLARLGAALAPAAAHPQIPPAAWATISGVPPLSADPMPMRFAPAPAAAHPWPWLATIWIAGMLVFAARWAWRWWRMRALACAAEPAPTLCGLPALLTDGAIEPGLFGLFRPVLLLPRALAVHVSPEQLQAIAAHESCHARRRDNLTAALHMMVEAAFWFHPLVWWIGARLVAEREQACDEAVVAAGTDAEAYAAALVSVCRHYVASPLACAAGMGGTAGAGLRRRVSAIMKGARGARLGARGRAGLALGALAVIGLPFVAGWRYAPKATQASGPQFEVVSIRPGNPDLGNGQRGMYIGMADGAEWRAKNIWLGYLIGYVHGVPIRDLDRVVGLPKWTDNQTFDITAALPLHASRDQFPAMVAAMLADRFHLKVHEEMRPMAAMVLTVAPGGAKLTPNTDCPAVLPTELPASLTPCGRAIGRLVGGTVVVTGRGVNLATALRGLAPQRYPLVDHTGLQGRFDFTYRFSHTDLRGLPRDQRNSISEREYAEEQLAMEQQLGLRLSGPSKQLVPVWVVDHVERPTPN